VRPGAWNSPNKVAEVNRKARYRPSNIPEGKPPSHDLGEFQGRAETFSGSFVLQPLSASKALAKRSKTNHDRLWRNQAFMSL